MADRGDEDIIQYIIRITDRSTGNSELQTITAQSDQEQTYDVTISSLEILNTYDFTIRGVDTVGDGPESITVSETTLEACKWYY